MIAIDLKPKAVKFIQLLPIKHQRQVKRHICALQDNPKPSDSKKLIGYSKYYRTDCGEYRVIHRYDSKKSLVTVVLVGKRNDSEVYRVAKRLLK